ncbi:MAG: amidohydrolase [Chitinophagaceae bacterium]|nr:MAG: amidohydrolase [Chitinophagaceae bacterium]
MTIDSHVHFWKYDKKRDTWITSDMKILREDYLPHTLTTTLSRNGMDGCIAVQADQSEVETRFYTELSQTYPVIKGVVGWVDLKADNVEERLEYFSQFPVIKGWRHIVQGEPIEFLADPAFRRGVGALARFGYTYDILIYHHQLKAAIDFVAEFPDQKFVIDHCAKPAIKDNNIETWSQDIKTIAQFANVHCKLSGLFTESNWKTWSPKDFYPYLDVVFEAFGTDRLMFGSDWPVMLLSGIYVQWKSLIEKYMESFNDEDKEKVFGLNAEQFYNL